MVLSECVCMCMCVYICLSGSFLNAIQRERRLGESRLLPCKKYLTLFSFSTTVVIKERIFYANKDLVCSFRSTA